MRKIILILTVLLIFGGYLYISRQNKLVISAKGKIEGLANKGRALVQRNIFWENQLKIATELYNKSAAPHPPSSSEMQALYRKYRQAEDSLNNKMKDLYTPEEWIAENYRIKADSVLRAAKWRKGDKETEAMRLKETGTYKAIVTAIEKKLKKGKP